jgi:hypothetical protein
MKIKINTFILTVLGIDGSSVTLSNVRIFSDSFLQKVIWKRNLII